MNERLFVSNEADMLALGARLAQIAKPGDIFYLQGELGAGKTTLTRGFLRALGVTGAVKSPTFTLVETYPMHDFLVFHFDLYRIKNSEELLEIGLSDYLTEDAICLIEWPEKAAKYLPEATYYCTIEIPDEGEGRWVTLK